MNKPAILSLLFGLLLRWIVSLHPYSGQQKPPMFGDYEAQRHWMEVTVNLPASEWYKNGTNNDLLYWGLDYPPLTAYHSYLMGKVARLINPEWVELDKSRGYESYHHKIFMRSTVLLSDLLIYISALFCYWKSIDNNGSFFRQSLIAPSLILIDYGHFQYNCISLGFLLWTIVLLQNQQDIIAGIIFCLALNYKQMALYYSLPIFFYLLKRCLDSSRLNLVSMFVKLSTLSIAVLTTFALLWLPYLSSLDSVFQVVRRIFPLGRGIYEDKVANFWYCLSILVKVKTIFSDSQLALISTFMVVLLSTPICYMLYRKNTIEMLKYSLFNVALIFFLFSFQVHEKTILFATSALMTLTDKHKLAVLWFELIATFSLLPLIIKDDLIIPYFALSIIYLTVGFNSKLTYNGINIFLLISILICTILSITTLTINPPSKLPDIHTLINCAFTFVHFGSFLLFFMYKQYLLYTNEKDVKHFTHLRSKNKLKIT
ncbi:Glucosyltransferase-like protein [Blomia tropicalis]|nr:Glucosyltransferase-like protein [Blomia tropicalis]